MTFSYGLFYFFYGAKPHMNSRLRARTSLKNSFLDERHWVERVRHKPSSCTYDAMGSPVSSQLTYSRNKEEHPLCLPPRPGPSSTRRAPFFSLKTELSLSSSLTLLAEISYSCPRPLYALNRIYARDKGDFQPSPEGMIFLRFIRSWYTVSGFIQRFLALGQWNVHISSDRFTPLMRFQSQFVSWVCKLYKFYT